MAIGFNKETGTDVGLGVATGGLYNVGKAAGLFGKKAAPIDISAQLAALRQGVQQGRNRTDALYNNLQPLTDTYKSDTNATIAGAKQEAGTERTNFLNQNAALADQAKENLRASLYSKEFTALPDTLRAVREASAAGGGLDTGSYQQAVKETGIDTARNIVQGERDIQAQGLQSQQQAQQTAYTTFANLSSKLNDQQLDSITKVMDTGREDLVRQTMMQMGLDETETQGVIDLMNFQASGNMANDQADAANKAALLTALIGGGSKIAGAAAGKPPVGA